MHQTGISTPFAIPALVFRIGSYFEPYANHNIQIFALNFDKYNRTNSVIYKYIWPPNSRVKFAKGSDLSQKASKSEKLFLVQFSQNQVRPNAFLLQDIPCNCALDSLLEIHSLGLIFICLGGYYQTIISAFDLTSIILVNSILLEWSLVWAIIEFNGLSRTFWINDQF